MAQSFPMNAWYAAAWDVEIKRALFPRDDLRQGLS